MPRSKSKNTSTPSAKVKHEVTEKTRKSVSICRMARMTDEEIADSYGITVAELHKHYGVELTQGAALRRRELIEQTYQRAMRGSPAAVKILERICQTPLPGETFSKDIVQELVKKNGPIPPPKEKITRLGKKAQAREDARTAERGTAWSDVLPQSEKLQ